MLGSTTTKQLEVKTSLFSNIDFKVSVYATGIRGIESKLYSQLQTINTVVLLPKFKNIMSGLDACYANPTMHQSHIPQCTIL